jgi:hypothetical protein
MIKLPNLLAQRAYILQMHTQVRTGSKETVSSISKALRSSLPLKVFKVLYKVNNMSKPLNSWIISKTLKSLKAKANLIQRK